MTLSTPNAIELRQLEKSFGLARIIQGVDLAVAKGERHAIIGPNGAGKSTLFNLITGKYEPTAGMMMSAPPAMVIPISSARCSA